MVSSILHSRVFWGFPRAPGWAGWTQSEMPASQHYPGRKGANKVLLLLALFLLLLLLLLPLSLLLRGSLERLHGASARGVHPRTTQTQTAGIVKSHGNGVKKDHSGAARRAWNAKPEVAKTR